MKLDNILNHIVSGNSEGVPLRSFYKAEILFDFLQKIYLEVSIPGSLRQKARYWDKKLKL